MLNITHYCVCVSTVTWLDSPHNLPNYILLWYDADTERLSTFI